MGKSARKRVQGFPKPSYLTSPFFIGSGIVIENPLSAFGSADGETSPASTRLSEAGPKGGADDKCTVYPYRFAGCRIFSCKGNPDFQSALTESVIKKFKHLCDEFDVPYRYLDLPSALNTFSP